MSDALTPSRSVEELLASQLPATTIGCVNDGNGDGPPTPPPWGRWDNWFKDGEPWGN